MSQDHRDGAGPTSRLSAPGLLHARRSAKGVMSHDDDPLESSSDSPPDLKILGDEITLQPGGYVEPAVVEGKEEALMYQFASFRAKPLQ